MENIETLRQEALRLVQLEIDLLTQMESDTLISKSDKAKETKASYLSQSSVKEIKDLLTNESQKLTEFEMVVAVVGTMKAGKSTVINAIVGNEVVPNRNRPMTALPTLITHTRGQKEPCLEFPNNQPVNKLMKVVGEKLKKIEFQEVLKKHREDRDMNDLVVMIEKGEEFKTFYPDRDAIYFFLRSLNDLVRLAKDLSLDFPFNEYRNTINLPRINVEFTHLKEMKQMQGKLTLLDTPGPNEDGQDHLKKMLGEQLKRASAVLAVLDYTQLKSDADADVREQLSEIASLNEGRMFAFVNRYDQKDKNSDGIEATKNVVAQQLMRGRIDEDDIFPVSARYAYLTNRARNEIEKNGSLPELNEFAPEWLEDYVDFIVGNPRYFKPNNVEFITADIDYGWEKSMFSHPLEVVIKSAHEKSASLTIQAVSAKLNDYVGNLQNSISARKGTLSKTLEQIDKNISEIHVEILAVDEAAQDASNDLEKAFNETDKQVQAGFANLTQNTIDSINQYFEEGKRIEQKSKEKNKSKPNRKTNKRNKNGETEPKPLFEEFSKFLKGIRDERTTKPGEEDFDPNSPVIEFDSQRDADNLLNKIQTNIELIFKAMETALKNGVEAALIGFNHELEQTSNKAQKQIKGMQERLAAENIQLSLNLPNITKLDVEFSLFDVLVGMVNQDQKSMTGERRQDGVWGSVCSWFGTSDWGWESYTYKKDIYVVDITKVKSSIMSGFNKSFASYENQISTIVKQPLEENLKTFFDNFRKIVEAIRADFIASMNDKRKSKEEQAEIEKSLDKFSQTIESMKDDLEDLKKEVS